MNGKRSCEVVSVKFHKLKNNTRHSRNNNKIINTEMSASGQRGGLGALSRMAAKAVEINKEREEQRERERENKKRTRS